MTCGHPVLSFSILTNSLLIGIFDSLKFENLAIFGKEASLLSDNPRLDSFSFFLTHCRFKFIFDINKGNFFCFFFLLAEIIRVKMAEYL
jgi:hypothetical protein